MFPNGLVFFCSKSNPRLVSYLTIIASHTEVYVDYLQKSATSSGLLDHGEYAQRYAKSSTDMLYKERFRAL